MRTRVRAGQKRHARLGRLDSELAVCPDGGLHLGIAVAACRSHSAFDHRQGRRQRDACRRHLRKQIRLETHAVLDGVDPGCDRRLAGLRVVGMDCHPPAGVVDGGDDGSQHIGRDRLVVTPPVADELGPAGPARLLGSKARQLGVTGTPSPAVEELTVLGKPRTRMHGARQVRVCAEPVRRLAS